MIFCTTCRFISLFIENIFLQKPSVCGVMDKIYCPQLHWQKKSLLTLRLEGATCWTIYSGICSWPLTLRICVLYNCIMPALFSYISCLIQNMVCSSKVPVSALKHCLFSLLLNKPALTVLEMPWKPAPAVPLPFPSPHLSMICPTAFACSCRFGSSAMLKWLSAALAAVSGCN